MNLKTALAHFRWPIAVTPRAMSPDAVMVCGVMGGYPMPTSLAMVDVLRRCLFHRGCSRWRRHVLGRSSRHFRGRWRSLLLRTRGQADDRQGSDNRYDKGF